MLGALVLASVLVQPGQTLSGIAASHGISLAAIEHDNPQVHDPNLIYVGEKVYVTGGHSSWKPSYTPSPTSSAPGTSSYSQGSPSSSSLVPGSSAGSSGFHIPGMPDSMASCIAYRESTNDTNPAAGGNAFGIIPASGHNVSGLNLGQQEQVAGQIYAAGGGAAWASDGCPGT